VNFALVYLVNRVFYRIADFFHHWYIDGSRRLLHDFVSFLEKLDKTFAIKVTFKYFFQPLYKDYTVIGRILGLIFRSSRILIALFVYTFFSLIFLVVYACWLLIPPALIFYAIAKF
jgi:hypothetical protein